MRIDARSLLVGFFVLAVGLASVFVPPLAGFAQEEEAAGAVVQTVRVGQDGARTRLVLEFAPGHPAINYRWFTLPDPARVVVDFGDTGTAGTGAGPGTGASVAFASPLSLVTLPDDSLVKGMRAGKFRPGTVRMVMDLQKAGRINVFGIPATPKRGARLVMDVVPVKAGQKPTDIPPPQDVVDAGKAPVVKPVTIEDEPAPVVPPQVVKTHKDRVLVVLDPGHGGVDPGACGRRLGLCEKGLTLKMARLVRERLRSDRVDVILTRDSDVFVPLAERSHIAQRAGADLFVSLHADIHPRSSSVKGATVYMVSERASDREAARLADSENAGDVLAGVGLDKENAEVRNILISLVQRDTLNNSAFLGRTILDRMGKVTEVRKDDLLFAGFRVLKAPDVPSVLVEMGYLSNPVEERQLNNPKFREKLADAIAAGVREYVAKNIHY